jgi:O-methyltransferase
MKYIIEIVMKWLVTTKATSVSRKYVGRILVDYWQNKGITLTSLSSRSPEAFGLIRQVKEETAMLITYLDAYQIYTAVKATEKIKGEIAEVGVYRGGSARIIREVTKKPIHLFDTFEGLPGLSKHDNTEQFQKGEYAASLESVKSYLKNYSNIYFYKGVFPSSSGPIKNKRFSFVNLDIDLYESTLNCLEFFYRRMSKMGVIIIHDYPASRGVKKAVDNFFGDKPGIIIDLSGTLQCLIIKE